MTTTSTTAEARAGASMPATLTVLWRGSLASCNYGCDYCPFAKTKDDKAALAADQAALERFEDWITHRPYPISVLITPWGEALIRNYYRDTMVRLSHRANVPTIAIQTNLSCAVTWVAKADLRRLALWTTYHPGETERAAFLGKIEHLHRLGARFSVGVVGLKEHFDEIAALKAALPPDVTLWINAYKRVPDYYSAAEVDWLAAADPLFELNLQVFRSKGRACAAGESAISVLADGTARRCHFLAKPIGNIYEPNFEAALKPRDCPADVCRCHIGYSHLKDLNLASLYGDGLIERRPIHTVTRADIRARLAAFNDPNQTNKEGRKG